jgi:hypothetical protein
MGRIAMGYEHAESHLSSAETSEGFFSRAQALREVFAPSKRLLLVQAPQLLFEAINLDVVKNRGCYAYPPTGLQWLAMSLASRGLEIEICDLNFLLLQKIISVPNYDYHTWLDILDDHLKRFQPSIVGVTCLSVYTDLFNPMHPLTAILHHLMNKEKYIVLAGGPTISNEIEGYLERDLCHFVVRGEGEYRINYLLDALLEEKVTHPAVDGIYYLNGNTVNQTSGSHSAVSIKGNLIESYRHIPVEEYCNLGCLNPYSRMAGQDTIYGVFQLNRGCRGSCSFCGVRPFMGNGIRTHEIDRSLEEVSYLVRERGVRHFDVLDDDFLAVPAAAIAFLKGLAEIRQRFKITWAANNGLITHSITNELLDLMRDSGCIGFKIGIESGNVEMLRRIKKPGTPAIFRKIAALLQGYPQLFVGGNYIIGFFGDENFSQMLNTYRLSVELNLDWSSFSLFQVTNKSDAISEKLKAGGEAIDFIPTKSSASRDIEDDRLLPLGPNVFKIPYDIVPSRELIKNIWFTFNLMGNYIGNKNLKPGGDAGKFVRWVEAVSMSYPANPYMRLFAGLGRTLMGDKNHANSHKTACATILAGSANWRYRFDTCGLIEIMKQFPECAADVYTKLDDVIGLYGNT